jgi:flagellar motor protein MotB
MTARLFRAVLADLLLVASLQAADPAAKPAPDKAAKDAPAADKQVSLGTLAGILQNTAGSDGSFVLRVTFRYLEPNVPAQENYVRQVQQLMVRQQRIMLNPNLGQAQQQLIQLLRDAERLQQSQKDLLKVKSVEKNVELELAEDVKVRSAQPVQQFDDKGNIKRYTAKELRELKGNEKMPGFPAELSDLQPGQTVLVKVVRRLPPKSADRQPPKAASSESNSSSSSSDIHLLTSDHRILVSVVLILGDPMK